MISRAELFAFALDYGMGAYPHQRVGQAFINEFTEDTIDPELFYEEDNQKCFLLIRERYMTND